MWAAGCWARQRHTDGGQALVEAREAGGWVANADWPHRAAFYRGLRSLQSWALEPEHAHPATVSRNAEIEIGFPIRFIFLPLLLVLPYPAQNAAN